MGQFSICKLKWDFLRTSVTPCAIDENTFFCPIWNLLCENGILKSHLSKKFVYKPLMGHSLFSNSHFQMGVTVIGFAEHFGHRPRIPVLFPWKYTVWRWKTILQISRATSSTSSKLRHRTAATYVSRHHTLGKTLLFSLGFIANLTWCFHRIFSLHIIYSE